MPCESKHVHRWTVESRAIHCLCAKSSEDPRTAALCPKLKITRAGYAVSGGSVKGLRRSARGGRKGFSAGAAPSDRIIKRSPHERSIQTPITRTKWDQANHRREYIDRPKNPDSKGMKRRRWAGGMRETVVQNGWGRWHRLSVDFLSEPRYYGPENSIRLIRHGNSTLIISTR